eukprot:scaffold82438_cov65-Attheya_sp.AAC.2
MLVPTLLSTRLLWLGGALLSSPQYERKAYQQTSQPQVPKMECTMDHIPPFCRIHWDPFDQRWHDALHVVTIDSLTPQLKACHESYGGTIPYPISQWYGTSICKVELGGFIDFDKPIWKALAEDNSLGHDLTMSNIIREIRLDGAILVIAISFIWVRQEISTNDTTGICEIFVEN